MTDFRIIGLEKVRINNPEYLRAREAFWIKKLATVKPKGLNKKN
jgi:hypothetical protein